MKAHTNRAISPCGWRAGTKYTTLVEESDAKYRKLLEDEGVKITEIEDYTPWKEAVQPVYDKWEDKLGKEFIDGVHNLVEW